MLQILPTQPIKSIKYNYIPKINPAYRNDFCAFENPNIDKKVLIQRKIINQNQNINDFFDNISNKLFSNSNDKKNFSTLLKGGYVSLSSNAYSNLNDPKSAVAIKLNPKKTTLSHCVLLENSIKNGFGIGINFKDFQNPTDEIKKINKYFKFRESSLSRPPALIGLLPINHPKILDFIHLKDNKDYKNWCFDLSVIINDDFLTKVDNNKDLILKDGSKVNAKTIYNNLLSSMLKSGEPAIIFSNNENYLCDCCAAAELKENQGLKLAHINLSKFYDKKTNTINYKLLKYSANLLSKGFKNIASDGFIGVLGYQKLLDYLGYNYGEKNANEILENCLKIIKKEVNSNGLKTAISPTGTISRLLKTTPSIEPHKNKSLNYYNEIDTLATAQKYTDGQISKTINLAPESNINDINQIIRYSKQKGIKGISVFKVQ